MVKNFNKKAKNYEKTICAAISILAFLVIWQLVVSFTKAGMVLAGDRKSTRLNSSHT